MRKDTLGQPQAAHHGWETALGQYRKTEGELPKFKKLENYLWGLWYGITRTLCFRTTHKYWAINWLTFALLSVACLVLAQLDTTHANKLVFLFFVSLSVISAFHNLSVVGQLTAGGASYKACFSRWEDVLEELDQPRGPTHSGAVKPPA
jgi:hypothetical protein